jgi:hypothetical protein
VICEESKVRNSTQRMSQPFDELDDLVSSYQNPVSYIGIN